MTSKWAAPLGMPCVLIKGGVDPGTRAYLNTISTGRGKVRIRAATSVGLRRDASLPPTAAMPNPVRILGCRTACEFVRIYGRRVPSAEEEQ